MLLVKQKQQKRTGAYALFAFLALNAAIAHGDNSAGSIEFFEKRIRPVLVKHCFECHSSQAKEVRGSLWLDSADAMREGGDSGPVIEPGNVDASLLISAIRYESTEMPPSGKLPAQTIADFEAWVSAGAIDPREPLKAQLPHHNEVMQSEINLEEGRKFWAFQPLENVSTPVLDGDEERGMIDSHLLDRLNQENVMPNGVASPTVRLRRLAFDLTGLPPSLELQDRWSRDPSEKHWRHIVDSMLTSPQFGEHWGRHWLDVARYADSNGSDFNATFHDAWRYREYVIDSFNRDRPFDEFVAQQVAGDLMTANSEQDRYDQIVATTFLMLGTKMLSERDKAKLEMDVVDEQIDTVGRAFLGLTLGCARCHDHKFDPIPTRDYYALAGIFRSTRSLEGESQKYVSSWPRTPLPTNDEFIALHDKHRQNLLGLKKELRAAENSLKTQKTVNQSSLGGVIVDDADATKTGKWTNSTSYKHFIGNGYVHDNSSNRGEVSIQFRTRLESDGQYEVLMSHSPGANRSSRVVVVVSSASGDQEVRVDQRKNTIDPMWSTIGTFEFTQSDDAVVTVLNRDSDGYVIADAIQFIPAKTPASNNAVPSQRIVEELTTRVAELTAMVQDAEKNAPSPLPTAMAVSDHATNQIGDCNVYIRGEVKNVGPLVPRGFLQVCNNGTATIAQPNGSGRLELADWLTDPDHPLVSRVIVNRVWMHLMGEGIVRTVDNFGSRGEMPSHPELLDAMALGFVRGGWKIKPLIREIVCSNAYSRSAAHSVESVAKDPENRLWWRMPRRRVPAEAIRDTMLLAAGKLDGRPTTEPVKAFGVLVSGNNANDAANNTTATGHHRSVYESVIRGYVSPLMTMLDAADPDLIVGRRPTTNVPSQALVLVNSPDVHYWSKATAKIAISQTMAFDERLSWLYRTTLQRLPNEQDVDLAQKFGLDLSNSDELWAQYVTALFASTEFRLLE